MRIAETIIEEGEIVKVLTIHSHRGKNIKKTYSGDVVIEIDINQSSILISKNESFLRCEQADGHLHINSIYVSPFERGKGVGTVLLEELLQYADEEKCNVSLEIAPPYSGSMIPNDLFKWYGKYGFENQTKILTAHTAHRFNLSLVSETSHNAYFLLRTFK